MDIHNYNKENSSLSGPTSTKSSSMKIKNPSLSSSRNPISIYNNNSVSHSLGDRRQSILLLSESAQSRKSGILNGLKKYGRNNNSNSKASSNLGSLGKSVDSKVFIQVNSPNFKSDNQDEIINSLSQQNYLNLPNKKHPDNQRRDSTDAMSDAGSSYAPLIDTDESVIGSACEDESDDEADGIDLEEHDSNLNQSGGDVTRDIYALAKKSQRQKKIKRSKSTDDISAILSGSRRGSTASVLNVPGGFRRHHIVQKVSNKTASPSNSVEQLGEDGLPVEQPIEKVSFLTRNFLEFLYVYGHFAGESFENEIYPENMLFTDSESNEDEEDENTPLVKRGKAGTTKISAKGTTSTFKAFLLLIKSFIGTGVLFLPKAFSNGGLTFCLVMLTFFGAYSYWCYYLLIKSKVATNVSSFGDIGAKLYGPWMKVIILFSLVVTQLGFAAAYVVFTSTNLMAFFNNVFHFHEHVRMEWFLILQIFVFIPLSFIRNVSKLSLPSLFANGFIMAGLVIVIVFVVKHLVFDLNMKPAEGIIFLFNPSSWSLFIGTAIFAFEGIGLIIPVQDSMKHPEQFPKVLMLVIITACVLFITVATLGYLAYGSSIETVILLNLPQTNIFVNLIQFFYSLAILLSTPLQLFPAIAIIENKILKPTFVNRQLVTGKTNWKLKWTKNFIRSLIVIFTVGIAYFGSSNLDKFVSIVGCFACIPLVYMYPPMLHLSSCSKPNLKQNPTFKNKCKVWLDYALLTFGGVSMVYTSYQCIFGNA